MNQYTTLSAEARKALESTLVQKTYKKNDILVAEGEIPSTVAFVSKGLLSQYHTTEGGDVVIKRFFPENYFAASMSALLKQAPSMFTIRALEDTDVWEYRFEEFRKLTRTYSDIADFYMTYLERHWILEKEPLEISLRHDPAKVKYADFHKAYPLLESRLKQHEIAAYLGITPTQLSRIRAEK